MSQLIQLKHRIQAVETIKKITNAMRITAMSTHSKLSHQAHYLKSYEDELKKIYSLVQSQIKQDSAATETAPSNLLVIIGSDKGLCGNFNSALLGYFKSKIKEHGITEFKLFAVGKKIGDMLKASNIHVDFIDENFAHNKIGEISDAIFKNIQDNQYSNVEFFFTKSKNFFIQQPSKYTLIPSEKIDSKNSSELETDLYVWPEDPAQLIKKLKDEFLRFSIKRILFDSIFAEQSARFKSMDSATRNAESILEEMQILYSKLRQAKITKELTELSGHF